MKRYVFNKKVRTPPFLSGVQLVINAKKEKDSSSFCSPEKKRIFAEKETFSSIPVDGKCRNTSGSVEALQQ